MQQIFRLLIFSSAPEKGESVAQTCWSGLKRSINEKVVASCWLFTLLCITIFSNSTWALRDSVYSLCTPTPLCLIQRDLEVRCFCLHVVT